MAEQKEKLDWIGPTCSKLQCHFPPTSSQRVGVQYLALTDVQSKEVKRSVCLVWFCHA